MYYNNPGHLYVENYTVWLMIASKMITQKEDSVQMYFVNSRYSRSENLIL